MWTYNPALLANRDRVRALIGDTDESEPLVQDEELTAYLPASPTPLGLTDPALLKAAYGACMHIVAKFSRKVSLSVGGASASLEAKARAYRELAQDLLARAGGSAAIMATVAPYAGGLSLAEKATAATDSDLPQPAFRRTLFTTSDSPDDLIEDG